MPIRWCAPAWRPFSARDDKALTPRESDVLRLLAAGYCNKRIARQLGVEVVTVKTHLNKLMAKLGATARTQAVILAAQRGLVAVGPLA